MDRQITVLVAEDDANDALLLKLAASKAHLDVALDFVQNGREAIQYLSHCGHEGHGGPCVKLVLLDLAMPATNGFEVLEWLRTQPAEVSRIPVIAVTGLEYRLDVERALALGASEYIQKPQDPEQLVRELEGLAEKYDLPVKGQGEDQPAAVPEWESHPVMV